MGHFYATIFFNLDFKAGWINVWHNHLAVDITMVWIFLPLVYFKNPALFKSTSFQISVKKNTLMTIFIDFRFIQKNPKG